MRNQISTSWLVKCPNSSYFIGSVSLRFTYQYPAQACQASLLRYSTNVRIRGIPRPKAPTNPVWGGAGRRGGWASTELAGALRTAAGGLGGRPGRVLVVLLCLNLFVWLLVHLVYLRVLAFSFRVSLARRENAGAVLFGVSGAAFSGLSTVLGRLMILDHYKKAPGKFKCHVPVG